MSVWLAALWPGLAFAGALGAGVGWLCGPPRAWRVPAALAVALLLVGGAAASGLVPGAGGLWVETAAGMLGAYLAACGVGALARRLARAG